jgi:uncharacterized protein YndB with AHSA1/START domain
MRALKLIVLALVLIVAAVYTIGWLLPVGHVASRSVNLRSAPQSTYDVITDVEHYPRWWPEISSVEMLGTEQGRVRFRQHTSTGPIVMEIVETIPSERLVTRIADPDQPFGGTWTFELTPQGDGTRLTITERGEVYDPLFRFMSRFVFGHTGTMESCLAALEARQVGR